jgi:hypothetical protein
MTTLTDICNRSLQQMGTRTTVSDSELANSSSNEAIQFNLIYANNRDDLLRMAPWNCGLKTANLTYISSVPGTPENTSAATNLWQPGQPAPPWAYEYQYPVDCLRPCWIIPSTQTGFASGVPITTAVTGGASSFWQGGPVPYKVQNDQFRPVTAAAVVSGGTGYAVGDVITGPVGLNTNPPIGAPIQLLVTGEAAGVITSVDIVNVINGLSPAVGGSYFAVQPNPMTQGSTTGSGSGATFNLTFGPTLSQRVILTNQEFATLSYVMQVTDPNVMDTLFQSAWISINAASMVMALTGDKKLANNLIGLANADISQARTADGNEGLTINNVTPDWIRIRGLPWTDGMMSGPYAGFDWGNLYPMY